MAKRGYGCESGFSEFADYNGFEICGFESFCSLIFRPLSCNLLATADRWRNNRLVKRKTEGSCGYECPKTIPAFEQ